MSPKPKTLRETVESFVNNRHDVTEKTRDNYRYRLGRFVEHLDEIGVDSVGEIEGIHVEQYKRTKVEDEEWAPSTLRNHVVSIRAFLQWCEKVGLADEGASDVVLIPDVSPEEEARDEIMEHNRARQLVKFLSEYHFGSLQHVVFHTLYHTGMRRSSIVALDVEDWNPEGSYLSLRHRPAQGTRLKGEQSAERDVAVTDDDLAEALGAWVSVRRPEAIDDAGRCPLFTSGEGRLHGQTVTKICYRVTRPCWYSDECPHDREPDSCEWTKAGNRSSCPSARSAHTIRRSAITNHLREDVSKDIVTERMSVSREVLEQHYDERTKEKKQENRASALDDKNV